MSISSGVPTRFKLFKMRWKRRLDPSRLKPTRETFKPTRIKSFIRNHKIISSMILSTALQFVPQVVSRPLDEHMQSKGMPTLEEYNTTKDIRVYYRYNPLIIWHEAGKMTQRTFEDNVLGADRTTGGKILSTAITPITYIFSLGSSLFGYVWPEALDAHAIPDISRPLEDRSGCYIKPPRKQAADDFINSFADLKAKDYTFASDSKTLSNIFYQFVMAHEARHCDQNFKIRGSGINDSDADIYAFHLVRALSADTAAVDEARKIMEAIRLINGVARGHVSHYSAPALERNGQTPLQAQTDWATGLTLHKVLDDAKEMNHSLFPDNMKDVEIHYHIAKQALAEGRLKLVPELERTARAFLEAVDYLDNMSTEKKVITNPGTLYRLDLNYMDSEYNPAPNRIPAARALLSPNS